MRDKHCKIENKSGKVILTVTGTNAAVMINGKFITKPATLYHNDRVRMAENNFFRFVEPSTLNSMSTDEITADEEKYSYAFMRDEAMEEVTKAFKVEDSVEDLARRALLDKALAEKDAQFAKERGELIAK